ncbi:MAG: hypothetical protein WBK55_08345 [Alphaproteobacteria bacterium]
MFSKYALTEDVNFTEGNSSETACALEAERKAADTAEQVEDLERPEGGLHFCMILAYAEPAACDAVRGGRESGRLRSCEESARGLGR